MTWRIEDWSADFAKSHRNNESPDPQEDIRLTENDARNEESARRDDKEQVNCVKSRCLITEW